MNLATTLLIKGHDFFRSNSPRNSREQALDYGLILQHSRHIMFDVVIQDLRGMRRKFD